MIFCAQSPDNLSAASLGSVMLFDHGNGGAHLLGEQM
jgi:hypothetical protein